jgi:hypothetical protein
MKIDSNYSYQTVGTFRFLIGEGEIQLESGGPLRVHRRAVAINSKNEDLDGQVIFYSDSYATRTEPITYVYTRHRSTPLQFLQALDDFYATEDFEELRGAKFPFVSNFDGRLAESVIGFPFTRWFDERHHEIRFVRISMPFGDLSIEFADPSITVYANATQLMVELPEVRFDSPLLAVETSRSTVLLPLLAHLHWASDKIPYGVLTELANQIGLSAVTA